MDYFGEGKEIINNKEWDWSTFKDTSKYPVSKKMLDWVIGQEKAMEECSLCLDEWIHKLKLLKKRKWWKAWEKPEAEKPVARTKLSPGPYLLLLGDPGTGKSLIGRALAEKLTELYKKHKIQLYDVLCWENKVLPSEPKISIVPPGKGREIVQKEKLKDKWKQILTRKIFKTVTTGLFIFGLIVMTISLFLLGYYLSAWNNPLVQAQFGNDFWAYFAQMFLHIGLYSGGFGSSFLFTGLFAWYLTTFRFGQSGGIAGTERTSAPKLIIENPHNKAPFIDATGRRTSQMFGSIAWDPYQTGGLGTPEHQRVTAGDVHRASLGILYCDEIKNLTPEDCVQLLTVLEDGQLPITMRSRWSEAGSAAFNVATEPVPALCFLVAAGNFDSIPQIHPALMDRIYGYGKVVRMENDMPNTLENRRKYVQFIAQEIERFKLLPFSREACMEIVDEGRRRSNKRDTLTTKFRPLISIIKTASVLAINDNSKVVERKHVIDAIDKHCLTIQRQLLEHQIREKSKFLEIEPKGTKLGQTYGLVVITDPYSGEQIGNVIGVKAYLEKKSKRKQYDLTGFYKVTGIAKEKEAKWIKDSVDKVRSVILKKYGIDVAQDYFTHIDFMQSYGIDGPSAGVTMTLLLCSLLEGRPIRQDIAITGEINISSTDEIIITAVGGVHEKIKAAERWGFTKAIIPLKNYKYSIDPNDYNIEVVGCNTLDDYLKHCLVDKK